MGNTTVETNLKGSGQPPSAEQDLSAPQKPHYQETWSASSQAPAIIEGSTTTLADRIAHTPLRHWKAIPQDRITDIDDPPSRRTGDYPRINTASPHRSGESPPQTAILDRHQHSLTWLAFEELTAAPASVAPTAHSKAMQHNNTNNNNNINNNGKREGDPLPCGEPEVECGSPQGKRARLSPPASPWGAAAQGAVFSINKRKGEALSSEDSLEAGESSRAKRSRSSPAGPEEAVDVVLLEEDDSEVVFRLPSPVLRLGQLRQILRNLTPAQLEDLQRPLTESEVEDSLDSVAEGSSKPMVENSSHGLEDQGSFSAAETSPSSAPSAPSLISLAPPALLSTFQFTFSFPTTIGQAPEAPEVQPPPSSPAAPAPFAPAESASAPPPFSGNWTPPRTVVLRYNAEGYVDVDTMPPCFPVAVFLSNFVEELNLPPQSFPAPVIPDDFVDEWDFDDFVDELDLDDLVDEWDLPPPDDLE
ncbi:hypothetical protein B0O80DRAFT_490697 [Mortierella sp. GBAus27b]|nr:hypothetical protein B0O80DRAFT_490697 [Mortierella sp. GBAus27b]